MEHKTAVILQTSKNDRIYQFIIPMGAPYGEVFDVAFEMLAGAEEFSKKAVEQAKKALEEARAKENENGQDAGEPQEVQGELA